MSFYMDPEPNFRFDGSEIQILDSFKGVKRIIPKFIIKNVVTHRIFFVRTKQTMIRIRLAYNEKSGPVLKYFCFQRTEA